MTCATHPEKEATGACVYCGKLFCAECLVDVSGKNYCKADVSKAFQEAKAATTQQPTINIHNVANATANAGSTSNNISPKSKIVLLILAVFLGGIGIHRFYAGKIGTGIIWMFTAGLFGIGWLIDIISAATGSFRDSAGQRICQ